MSDLPKQFVKASLQPEVTKVDENANYGKFVVSPLERGYGLTLGNSLRRILLASLPGASVYGVEIEGAQHEFSALEGIEVLWRPSLQGSDRRSSVCRRKRSFQPRSCLKTSCQSFEHHKERTWQWG